MRVLDAKRVVVDVRVLRGHLVRVRVWARVRVRVRLLALNQP